MFELGDKVKDKVTGFTGIATERHEYLNGCVQYSVCAKVKKDGAMGEEWRIDDQQLIRVSGGINIKIKPKKTGGPMRRTR